MSLIYREYFNRRNLSKELSAALMCGLYYFSVMVNTVMIRADIILNGALISMAGQHIGEAMWMLCMTVPTLALILLSALLYLLVFRKTLSAFPDSAPEASKPDRLTRQERRNLLFLVAVALVWAAEEFHPISGAVVVLIATVLMFPFYHVILLLGEGSASFSTKELLRIALPHTALVLLAIFLLYLPWWLLTKGL